MSDREYISPDLNRILIPKKCPREDIKVGIEGESISPDFNRIQWLKGFPDNSLRSGWNGNSYPQILSRILTALRGLDITLRWLKWKGKGTRKVRNSGNTIGRN